MKAFELLKRVREISPTAANAALSRIIPFFIPLAGGLRVRVRELTDVSAELTMPVFRRTRNHIGSMYFGAQMTLADLTVGMLLLQRFPPGPFGGVIKEVDAKFRVKAKGLVRCRCVLPPEAIEALEVVRSNESGKAEASVPLQLLNSKGEVVTDVRFVVAVKRF